MKRLMSPHFAVTVHLILFCVLSQAQVNRPMAFDTYRAENGLVANWVESLAQDSEGNMWMGTSEGLSRFDGYSFKNYFRDPTDSTSLRADKILNIATDKTGNVWILTDDGMNLYNPIGDNFLRVEALDSILAVHGNTSTTESQALHTAANGSLYIGGKDGLIHFDPKYGTVQCYQSDSLETDQLPHGGINDLAEDSKGRIFVATEGHGIRILAPSTGKFSKLEDTAQLPLGTDSKFIRQIYITRGDVLWVGTGNNESMFRILETEIPSDSISALIWKLNLSSGESTQFKYLPKTQGDLLARLSGITETIDGTIWITRLSGGRPNLGRYIPENGSFQYYGHKPFDPSSLAWNYTSALITDRNGDIWVGTSRGVSKSNEFKGQFNRFSRIPSEPFNLENLFYTPLEIAQDQFLLLNDGGNSALSWNRSTGENEIIRFSSFRVASVLDTVFTKSIWSRSGYNSLGRCDYGTLAENSYSNPNAPDGWLINQIETLSPDTLLLTTSHGFWHFCVSTEKFSAINLEPGKVELDDYAFAKMVRLSDGSVYALKTTQNSQNTLGDRKVNNEINLYKIDLVNRKVLSHHRHILSNGTTVFGGSAVFFKDSKGLIWNVGTNMMIRFDPKLEQFIEFKSEPAYNGKMIVSAFEDNDGLIWFNSEEHISRLNPETREIQSIQKSDGLATFRMNLLSSTLTRRGEVLFAGVGGLTYFDPKTFKVPTEVPNILISGFEAAKQKLDYRNTADSPIKISSDDNSIDIEYKSITFRNAELTTYSHILEGWQKKWQESGTRRFVQFTNLPTGTYTFKVKATNSNGFESGETAQVQFTILPPWWLTWWAYLLYAIGFSLLLFAFIGWLRKRAATRERELNQERELAQAKEIEKAYHNLELAHSELKSTQAQLVQQEKLASLGQLTAGIAHEIKNPLNFVNNFSELNIEMVDEAMEELASLPAEKADPIKELLTDVKLNLEKILQHGTRADGIVTSMLQHSRGGTGKKEPTNLNALLGEFVNLAFHGMRASKNPINVKLDFDLDENLGQVNLVGEDFSRVVLNIANNAFDAMREKTKTDPEYKAVLTVSSKRSGDGIKISIADNGPGVPEDIKEKILQPFFTTKKGTDGTGLGLSITHDIIKAHGGELAIENEAEAGAAFIIKIPIT